MKFFGYSIFIQIFFRGIVAGIDPFITSGLIKIGGAFLGGKSGRKEKIFTPLGEEGLSQRFGQSAFGGINQLSSLGSQFAAGQGIIDPELFRNLETQGTEKLTRTRQAGLQSLQESAQARGLEDSGIALGQEQGLFQGFQSDVGGLLGQLQQEKSRRLQAGKEFGVNIQAQAEGLRGQRINSLNQLLAQGVSSENAAIRSSNQAIGNIIGTISGTLSEYFGGKNLRDRQDKFLEAQTNYINRLGGGIPSRSGGVSSGRPTAIPDFGVGEFSLNRIARESSDEMRTNPFAFGPPLIDSFGNYVQNPRGL